MEFSNVEQALANFFYDVVSIKGDVSFREYELAGSGVFRAGFGLVGDENNLIQVVFSIPQDSNDVYFIISDGDPDELAAEMAALQKHHEKVAQLDFDQALATTCNYVKDSGWFGYLISSPLVTWQDFPLSEKIDDRDMKFHLAIPISNEDNDIKMSRGVDALMDKYEAQERVLFSFKAQ